MKRGIVLRWVFALAAIVGVFWGSGLALAPNGPDAPTERDAPVTATTSDVRLILCGAQRGRLEPCGCSAPQRGGLRGLASLLDRELAADARVPTRVIQFGPALERTDRRLDILEHRTLRGIWRDLGVAVVHAGSSDLAVRSILATDAFDGTAAVPEPTVDVGRRATTPRDAVPRSVLPANVHPDGGPSGFASGPIDVSSENASVQTALLLGSAALQRLGEMGVIGAFVPPAQAARSLVEDSQAFWVIGVEGDPADVASVRDALRGRAVAVVQMGATESRIEWDAADGDSAASERAARGGGLHASSLAKVMRLPQRDRLPPLLRLIDRGRDVSFLDLARTDGGWTLTARVQGVAAVSSRSRSVTTAEPQAPDGRAETGARRNALVTRRLQRHQQQIRDLDLLADLPRLPATARSAAYIGSPACVRCHPSQAEDWEASAHRHAFATLRDRGRAEDPECVVCHTTGFERTPSGEFIAGPGAFRSLTATPDRVDVGCESCHGPGSLHARWPGSTPEPSSRVSIESGAFVARPTLDVCVRCHDADNSPHFGARGARHYLPRVDHRARRTAATPDAAAEKRSAENASRLATEPIHGSSRRAEERGEFDD